MSSTPVEVQRCLLGTTKGTNERFKDSNEVLGTYSPTSYVHSLTVDRRLQTFPNLYVLVLEKIGNPRIRVHKPSRKRKATQCHGVDKNIAKVTNEETQQTNGEVRPTTSMIAIAELNHWQQTLLKEHQLLKEH